MFANKKEVAYNCINMKRVPKSLVSKLEQREQNNSLRKLTLPSNLIDFSSNDYLGFSKSEAIFNRTHSYLLDNKIINFANSFQCVFAFQPSTFSAFDGSPINASTSVGRS